MNKERIYNFRVEIETVNDIIWFTDYDVLIVNGLNIDEDFWHNSSTELKKFVGQKVADYKFVEFSNGRVVALVQTV